MLQIRHEPVQSVAPGVLKWEEVKHPRRPKGSPEGGEFAGSGETVILYRGDSKTLSPALAYSDPAALFGAGIYLTDSKRIATDYQAKGKPKGEIFRFGGGPKTTKREAIDAYIRTQATYLDAEGHPLRWPERLHGYVGKFSTPELNQKAKEDAARTAHARKLWEIIQDTVEVRKLADHTIVITKKGQAGHLSEYAIPKSWIKKTLDAEAPITKELASALAEAIRQPGYSGVLSRELYAKAMTPNEEGFLPSFREIYRDAAQTSAWSGFGLTTLEGQLTLRRLLKEKGYKGIRYAGGISMGGVFHNAYVFWDEQGLKKRRQKQEHTYGSTHIQIAPTSSAASALNMARDSIRNEHCMATGKDVDPNHVTVRYGLLNEELDGLRTFIAAQIPFEAWVDEVELFPASEHSDGAVPVVARIASPELHAIEAEIGKYAAFKDKNFPEYKPHCTLAYCTPEAASQYANLFVHGSFVVQSITISHQSGVQETIPFGMTQKWNPNQPRDAKGRFADLGLHEGSVTLLHGTTRQHAEAILAEGFKPGNPARVAAQFEEAYGLPKDSILNHVAFEFAKGRSDLDRMHFTTDESVADQYSIPEVVQDALTAVHMLLYPTPEHEPYTKAKAAERKAWIAQEAKRLTEPALLAVTVPFETVGQHSFGKKLTLEEFTDIQAKFPRSQDTIFNNITIPIAALAGAKISRRKREGSVRFHNRPHWAEERHPRQPTGSSHGGEFMAVLHGPQDALDSLLNGEKNVSIDRHDVHRFLEKAGAQFEDPDLTDLQVEGLEIFGGNGLGIERDDMPQIPRNHRHQFLEALEKEGVRITEETVDPLTLKPTQNKISARRVAEKLAKYEQGDKRFPPVLVSQENRILDGHHHWGMMAAFSLEVPGAKMPIYRIHLTTKKALAFMHAYMKKHGLKREALSGEVVKWDESKHPRDAKGEFEAKVISIFEKNFEETDNYGGTKFILPSGKRLAHSKDSHWDAAQSVGVDMFDAMRAGIIRYTPGTGAEIGAPITSVQASHLVDATVQSGGHSPLFVDVFHKKKRFTRTFDPDKHTADTVRNWVNSHFATKKADPVSGRYVTPFVSFDKQGDDALRMIASLNSSRLATWGFTAEAEVLGMARYRITAVLDGRTSKFCRMIDGKIFEVDDARRKVIECLNVQNPEDLKVVQPWPKQNKAAMEEFATMSTEEFVERGLHIPPYHPYCRTLLRPLKSSIGEEMDTTPTLPEETEVFQLVSAADLKELGIDATPEEVAQWNEHIGMTPVELLSRLTDMRPQEVMTKGQGVGANPIVFEPSGEIAFKARGESSGGVEFKLGALLDPFTGIYYLTQADLLAGTPKAELAFLKNLFSTLLDMGEKSTATSIAVGVGGNAIHYAKMGFLPDELEWDSLRTYALEGNTMIPEVLASLAPDDELLVRHLLQDKSVGAMSALVELPFTYQGKTIGEWLFGEATGTWALDLTDEMMVAQARAYVA